MDFFLIIAYLIFGEKTEIRWKGGGVRMQSMAIKIASSLAKIEYGAKLFFII